MNKKLKDLALHVGGSHYPEVSKQYLEHTVRMVIKECAAACLSTDDGRVAIEQHFLQRFDLE
jgi:hypothetical protein